MTGHGKGSKARPVCARKAVYRSIDQAKTAATRIQQSGGPKMRAYRCPLCGRVHLTSQGQLA